MILSRILFRCSLLADMTSPKGLKFVQPSRLKTWKLNFFFFFCFLEFRISGFSTAEKSFSPFYSTINLLELSYLHLVLIRPLLEPPLSHLFPLLSVSFQPQLSFSRVRAFRPTSTARGALFSSPNINFIALLFK